MVDKEAILKDCTLPAMPHVGAKILRVVNDPLTSVEELQDTMISDQAITSRILMIANSAYYGLRRKVDTLSDALFVLGFEAVKKIAIAVSTKDIYNFHGLIEQKLWEHAIGVSIAAGLVGEKQSAYKVSIEECIVAGLLHDIGKAVMNRSQPERYAMVVETVYEDHIPFCRAEEDLFGFTHQEVGALLFQRWKLPDDLAAITGNHHKRHEIDESDRERGFCTVIAFADSLCVRLGVGYREPMPDIVSDNSGVTEELGLGIGDMEELIGMFKERYIMEKLSFLN